MEHFRHNKLFCKKILIAQKQEYCNILNIKVLAYENFLKKISISPSNFNEKNMISSLSGDILSRSLTEFEELNPDWLLLGKGEMLRGSVLETPSDTTLSALLDRISALARENGQLQAENAELKKEAHVKNSVFEK